MQIIGVDPGLSGAVVIMDGSGNDLAFLNMPTFKEGSKNVVNVAAVQAFLHENVRDSEAVHCYIEKVQYVPMKGQRQSGAAAFSFGRAAGQIEGLIAGMGIPYTRVAPQTWKKEAGLIGTDKDAARGRCIQLYPHLRILDLKAKGQAVADAILIARQGLAPTAQTQR